MSDDNTNKINGTAPLERLASLKPPRELTLGGIKPNKKVFTPNLNVSRNKNKGPSTSNSKDQTKEDKNRKDRNKKKDRNKFSNGPSIIKSTGVFSEGLGSAERQHSRVSYGRDTDTSATLQKPTIRVKDVVKIDKELEEQKIRSAFGESFHIDDDSVDFKDVIERDAPIKLPMDAEAWSKSQTKQPVPKIKEEVVVKEEPREEPECSIIPDVEQKPVVDVKKETLEDSDVENLLKTDKPTLILLQLPDTLPGRGGSVEDDIPKRKIVASDQPSTSTGESTPQKPMDTRLRATHKQFRTLIEFMERHGDLSRPQPGLQGKIRSERLWQELSEILNSVDGYSVNKPTEKWKKVWSDWKNKIKKKAQLKRLDVDGTFGGGPSGAPKKGVCINPLENRVLMLMGTPAMTGQEVPDAGYEVPCEWLQQRVERSTCEIPSPTLFFEVPPVTPPDQSYTHTQQQCVDLTPAPPTSPLPDPLSCGITQEESSPAPESCETASRRRLIAQRRRALRQTYDQATREFVALEQSRLRLERLRERHLFEIQSERNRLETERLRIDAERVQLERERLQVEEGRVRVEEGRMRVESERLINERALSERLQQLNDNIIKLLSKFEEKR